MLKAVIISIQTTTGFSKTLSALSQAPPVLAVVSSGLSETPLGLSAVSQVPFLDRLITDLTEHGILCLHCSPYDMKTHPEKPAASPDFRRINRTSQFADHLTDTLVPLSIQPKETLLLTNLPYGVLAAKSLGIACAGFIHPDYMTDPLPPTDVLIEGLEEIDTAFITEIWSRANGLPLTISTTSRILLRELCPEDFNELYSLMQHPEIQAASLSPISSYEEEKEKMQAYIKTIYPFYGFGSWGIFERTSGAFIGRCGLQPCTINGAEEIELGYDIAPVYHRQGFALEATTEVLRLAKEKFELTHVYARVLPENLPSRRLLLKLGFAEKKLSTNFTTAPFVPHSSYFLYVKHL